MTTKLISLSKLALVVSAVAAFSIGCNNNTPADAGTTGASAGATGGSTAGATGGTTGGGTATLAVAPSMLTFTSAVGTASAAQSVQVSNTGTGPSGLPTVAVSGANKADFSTTTTCDSALAAASACSVSVTFTPSTSGAETATLTVSATPGGSATVTLSGTGSGAAQMTITPNVAPFGSSPVNTAATPVVFTVTNSGGTSTGPISLNVSGANAGDFVIGSASTCGAALAGAATCTISVTFTPSAVGSESATLNVSATPGGSLSASMSGTGTAPGLSISPNSFPYGSAVVGAVSTAQVFTVTNTGTSSTGVPNVAVIGGDASQFLVGADTCTTAIAAAGTCTISVTFNPTNSGSFSASLSVTAAPGGTATAGLSGTGITAAALALAPPSENYGSVVKGTASSAVTFTASNAGGSATGTLTTSVTGTNAADFAISGDGCNTKTLAGGANCTLAVIFTPSIAGGESATLTVTDGTLTSSSTLTGSGATSATLTITNPVAFANTAVGSSSAAATITVTNTGTLATGTLNDGLSGANAAEFSIVSGGDLCKGSTLAANGTCTISVVFTPSGAGAAAASFTVTDGTGNGTAVSALSGTGILPGTLGISPASYSFGSIAQGDTVNQTTPFTISNTGATNTGTPVVTVTGANAADFTILANGCTAALTPTGAGASCTITLQFKPSSQVGESATLNVSATPGGTVTAPLSGSGTNPAAIAFQQGGTFTGSVFNYATTVAIGDDSSNAAYTNGVATFSVINNGAAATSPLSVSLTSGADFHIIAPTGLDCVSGTTSLASGASCTIKVSVKPTTAISFGTPAITDSLIVTGTPQGGSLTGSLTSTAQNELFVKWVKASAGLDLVVFGAPGGNGFTAATNTTTYGNVAIDITAPNVGYGIAYTVTNESKINTVAAAALTAAVAGDTADFKKVTDTCTAGAAIAPAGTCSVNVQYIPSTTTVGVAAATTLGLSGSAGADTMNLAGSAVSALSVAVISPAGTSWAFGNTVVQTQAVELSSTNNVFLACAVNAACGNLTWSATSGTDFGVTDIANYTGGAPVSGTSYFIGLDFFPQALGAQSSNVTFSAGTGNTAVLALTGTGVAAGTITVNPSAPTFTQVIGGTSAALPIAISYSGGLGDATLSGSLADGSIVTGSNGGKFTVGNTGAGSCAAVVAANTGADHGFLVGGQNCTVTLTYTPSTSNPPATEKPTLAISSSPSDTITLTGTSTSPISITPSGTLAAPVSFGAVTDGLTASLPFTVTNSSNTAIASVSAALFTSGAPVTVTGNNCAPLAALGTCTITVQLAPNRFAGSATYGAAGNPLTLTVSSAANPGIQAETWLSGSAQTVADLALGLPLENPANNVATATFNFGEVDVGSTSPAVTFTFWNNGQTPTGALTATLSAASTSFAITGGNCGVLAGGATCSVSVDYVPIAGGFGTQTGTLTVTDGVGFTATTGTVNLRGTRGTAGGSVIVTPTPFNYGTSVVGAAAVANVFTVTNTTNGTVNLTFGATGTNGDFAVASNTCAGSVAAGASCTVTVNFTANGTPLASGPVTGTLTIGGGLGTATLYGTEINPVILNLSAPVAGVNPSFTFPSVAVGTDSSPLAITVTNSGNVASAALAWTLTGTNPNQFSAVTGGDACTGAVLQPNGTCTVNLQYSPTQTGAATANWQIASGTTLSQVVALSGAGDNAATLSISPSGAQTLTGAVAVGNSNAFPAFTLSNGGQASSGTITISTGNPDFVVSSNCTPVLAGNPAVPVPGEYQGLAGGTSCSVTITFAPLGATTGVETATLTVTANPGTSAGGLTLGLTATSSSMLTFNASTYNFSTNPQTLTLTNNSTSTSTLVTDTVLGDTTNFTIQEDNCVGTTLTGGSSCTIVVYDNDGTNKVSTTLSETVTVGGSPAAVTLEHP